MQETVTESRRTVACYGAVLALAGFAAYCNALRVPFLFDDGPAIIANPTLRHWTTALSPPSGGGLTVEGRPLLNLSFAVNYFFGGAQPWGYHVLNIAIHVAAALALFGIVRRTIEIWTPTAVGRRVGDATLFGFTVALLWLLHPLQTEAVTYVAQRAESMMTLWLFLTLYTFIRGSTGVRPAGWWVASVACCALGMATKEVMVVAPCVVLLYDRTFVANGLAEAIRRRRWYYVALAGTWLLLIMLVVKAGNRGGTIGSAAGVAWWQYGLTQLRAWPHYLALTVWPQTLIFDYGTDFIRHGGDVAGQAVFDAGLLLLTWYGLCRRTALGFLGACFFLLLAPSSSVVGGTRQMLAEHRMYAALAVVVVIVLLGLRAACGRRGVFVGLAAAVALGWATVNRNHTYRDELSLWGDTVAKRPDNPWAQSNLGLALLGSDHTTEAMRRFRRAVELNGELGDLRNNLGNALLAVGDVTGALDQLEQAVRLSPQDPEVHNDLGNALSRAGRRDEAMGHYRTAILLDPDRADVRTDLGNVLAAVGKPEEAIAQYREAVRIDPTDAAVHDNWGNALLQEGQIDGAVAQYHEALRLRPNYPEAHFNLANALTKQDRLPEAIREYERALQLRPAYAGAESNLGNALLRAGRPSEAVGHYETSLRLEPGNAAVHYNLANALAQTHHMPEAIGHLETALRLKPDFEPARAILGQLRAAGWAKPAGQ